MKKSDAIDDVVSKLAEINSTEKNEPEFSTQEVSIRTLIALFEEAKSHESEHIVQELFSQAGYGWVSKLCASDIQAMSDMNDFKGDDLINVQEIQFQASLQQLTEDEFMNLVPANAYFH